MNLKSKILHNLYLSSVSKLAVLHGTPHCPVSIFHISDLYLPVFKVAWCSPILSAQKEWRKCWKITGGLCQVICVSIPFWYIQTCIIVGSAQGQNKNCPIGSRPGSAWYNNDLRNESQILQRKASKNSAVSRWGLSILGYILVSLLCSGGPRTVCPHVPRGHSGRPTQLPLFSCARDLLNHICLRSLTCQLIWETWASLPGDTLPSA